MSCRLLLAALALGSASVSAGTFSVTSQFDSTFNDSLTPSYVGSATMSYTSASQLADGHYLWSTLVSNYGMTFSMTFNLAGGGTTTFTRSDIIATSFNGFTAQQWLDGVTVSIVNGEFYFSNVCTSPTQNSEGSVLFRNATHSFAAEPVTLDGISPYRGSTFAFAGYTLGSGQAFAGVFMGNYGGSLTYGRTISNSPAVPEPSTYGLALGGLALVAVALRRRNKVSK